MNLIVKEVWRQNDFLWHVYQKQSTKSNFFIQSIFILKKCFHFNPIQDGGGGQKAPLPVFSPVTSTNVEIRPQNFLTFSFNPFDRLV